MPRSVVVHLSGSSRTRWTRASSLVRRLEPVRTTSTGNRSNPPSPQPAPPDRCDSRAVAPESRTAASTIWSVDRTAPTRRRTSGPTASQCLERESDLIESNDMPIERSCRRATSPCCDSASSRGDSVMWARWPVRPFLSTGHGPRSVEPAEPSVMRDRREHAGDASRNQQQAPSGQASSRAASSWSCAVSHSCSRRSAVAFAVSSESASDRTLAWSS
ncbi:hypothetical protein BH10ACT3_BH10ACT3_16400 [soil metagenome]